MKPQTDLFDLIKSLSPSEKRFFKIYATAIGGKTSAGYLKLFDFLSELKVYDEELVKRKFERERFVRQLSVLKNYLYDLILRSLLHYGRESRPDAELHFQLASVQLLYEKGLHKNCLRLIKKLKKTAQQLEEFSILDKLGDWEGRILMNEGNTTHAITKAKEQALVLQKRQSDLGYKLKSLEVYDHTKKSDWIEKLRSGEAERMYTELQKHDPSYSPAGILGSYYYHTAMKILARQLQNDKEHLAHASATLRQFERNKPFLEANLRLYFSVVYNYSIALTALKKYKRLREFVKQKREIINQLNDDRHKELKHLGQVVLLSIETMLYINKALPVFTTDSVSLAKKYIDESRNYSNAFYILELCRNMMHALFMEKSYEDALYFLNEILNDSRYKLLPLDYAQMRFREIFIHHEMGHHFLVNSLAENLTKLLRKQQRFHKFDLKLIKYLKHTETEKKADLLHQLLDELEGAPPSAIVSIMHDQIPLKRWLKEKLPRA